MAILAECPICHRKQATKNKETDDRGRWCRKCVGCMGAFCVWGQKEGHGPLLVFARGAMGGGE